MENFHVPYPREFQKEEEWEVEEIKLPEAMDQDHQEEDVAVIYAQNPQYYRHLLYQDEEEENEERENEEIIEEKDAPIIVEDEDWDNDGYNLRFDLRLGFFTDDYDSGVDEPNDLREPYNDFIEALDFDRIDEENRQLERFLIEQHEQRPPPDNDP